MSKPERVALDVSELPTVVCGQRSLLWWGTLGFAVIESVTMILGFVTVLYLRRNFHSWPPEGYSPPDWVVPTVNVAVMLVTLLPAYLLKKATYTLDVRRTTRLLVILAACGFLLLVLRWLDYRALHVRWTTSAYGSSIWVLVSLIT